MKSASDFVKECKTTLMAKLQKELAQAEKDLGISEMESAAWDKLHGTPTVNDATKNRYIIAHRDEWRQQVSTLKGKMSELRTDIQGLGVIAQ